MAPRLSPLPPNHPLHHNQNLPSFPLSIATFGPPATGISLILPENLAPAWYLTDQFVSEIIFHNRIINHKCRTDDLALATGFYVPFYAGLAVGKYLWRNYSSIDRDRHCRMLLDWIHDKPAFRNSNGWNHFMTMGRIWSGCRFGEREIGELSF
ncbi:hypothetical protein ACFE04_024925 [Oxalis oulophora]